MDKNDKFFFESEEGRVDISRELMSKYRIKIIEDFIMIEGYVTAIICKHYFGHLNNNFMREVLFDELCSSGFKANLFEKVLSRNKEIKKPRVYADQFRQISRYRNYFAHCNTTFSDNGFIDTPSGIPNSRKQDEYLDIKDIIEKFFNIHEELSTNLVEIMDKMGILFMHNTTTGNLVLICEDPNKKDLETTNDTNETP